MDLWIHSPEAASLLASCAARPPRRRLITFRFQETGMRFVGRRITRLRLLYRRSEPPLDSPEWRAWLELDPQTAIAQAVRASRPSRPTMRSLATLA
ncbi:MAG: hypothetical protein ACXWUN_02180 [Allosphingosinicella sp.]